MKMIWCDDNRNNTKKILVVNDDQLNNLDDADAIVQKCLGSDWEAVTFSPVTGDEPDFQHDFIYINYSVVDTSNKDYDVVCNVKECIRCSAPMHRMIHKLTKDNSFVFIAYRNFLCCSCCDHEEGLPSY